MISYNWHLRQQFCLLGNSRMIRITSTKKKHEDKVEFEQNGPKVDMESR